MVGFAIRDTLDVGAARSPQGPDGVALTFEDEVLTYRELADRVDRVAANLQRLGFAAGDRLLAILPNCVEYVELFYAAAQLRGVIVPVNYLLSAEEVRHIHDDSGAAWVVVDPAMTGLLDAIDPTTGPRVVVRGQEYDDTLRAAVSPPAATAVAVAVDDVLLLQYTSGTTGLPKAAVHTHNSLMWNAVQQIVDFGLTARDSYLSVPALCWAAGFGDFTVGILWVGGRVTLNPSRAFDPVAFTERVRRDGTSIVVLVPSVLRLVMQSGQVSPANLGSIRLVATGGEYVPVELLAAFQEALPECWVAQCYGMTEGPMIMTMLDRDHAKSKLGSAGRPMSMTTIEVRRPDGTVADPGEIGQIVVRSPASMTEYYEAPEQTANTVRDGWMFTGDNGYLDEEGYLYVAGRAKDMIISGGLNVYPAEIERVLLLHPAVREVAVVGVPDDAYGEVGRAHVVLTAGQPAVTGAELAEYARRSLAGFKVPKHWVIGTEALPRNASNKVLKNRLRATATPA